MVLSRMDLLEHATHTGPVAPHQGEQILDHEPLSRELVDNLDMRQSLLIGTDLIRTFHDVDAFVPQHAARFDGGGEIQVEYGLVVLPRRPVAGAVVPVILLVVLVTHVRRAAGCVHVGRIEDDTVKAAVLVGQVTAIDAARDVAREEPVRSSRDLLPEHALAVRDIGHRALWRDVEGEDSREQLVAGALVGREDELIRQTPAGDLQGFFGSIPSGNVLGGVELPAPLEPAAPMCSLTVSAFENEPFRYFRCRTLGIFIPACSVCLARCPACSDAPTSPMIPSTLPVQPVLLDAEASVLR